MADEQMLAAEVKKRLQRLSSQPLHEVAGVAEAIMAMLAPQGVIKRATMAFPEMHAEVLAEVMGLALLCAQRASENHVRQAVQSALFAADRWQIELRLMKRTGREAP